MLAPNVPGSTSQVSVLAFLVATVWAPLVPANDEFTLVTLSVNPSGYTTLRVVFWKPTNHSHRSLSKPQLGVRLGASGEVDVVPVVNAISGGVVPCQFVTRNIENCDL